MSMKPTFATRMTRVTRRALTGTAVLCGAAVLSGTALTALPGAAQAATTTAASPARTSPAGTSPAWSPKCTSQQTEIWLGLGLGGGTAGTIFYPVEFTNVGHHACFLWGFPKAAAISASGHQIGKSSRALRLRHGVVELFPGWTAHATLGIVEAGNVCSHPVRAASLRIRAPHQRASTDLPFAFQACHGRRVLVFGPIMPGVGIP
jgi:Protein of unknown function (DUF4232)